MDKKKQIPVILLTGFLGSGKTTLLNRLMTADHGEKLAVIVNEFGAVSIDDKLIMRTDEEVMELANGSMCCAAKSDTVKVLEKLMDASLIGASKFDRVVIETTGLANPAPVINAFLNRPQIRAMYALDVIVTMVDAYHILEQLDQQPEAHEQLVVADIVLINKTDLVDAAMLNRIMQVIRKINPAAKILPTQDSRIDVREILDFDRFEREIVYDKHEHHHEHDDQMQSYVLTEKRPLDLQKVSRWIGEHILLNANALLRYKGLLQIKGMDERFVFQGIHTLFENRKDRPWEEGETPVSEVVLIGKNIPIQEIEAGFHACAE